MNIINVIARPMPQKLNGIIKEDGCIFCNRSHEEDGVYTHSIWLPIRYKEQVVCDDCAIDYSVVTECCGDLG